MLLKTVGLLGHLLFVPTQMRGLGGVPQATGGIRERWDGRDAVISLADSYRAVIRKTGTWDAIRSNSASGACWSTGMCARAPGAQAR